MAGTETLELSTAAERAEELVRFLGGSDEQLLSTLAAFLPAGRYAELFTAVLERQGEVFKSHSDEDIEGVFTLLFSLLSAVEPSRHDAVIEATVAALTSSAAEKPLLRLHLVTNVFNSISAEEHKDAKLSALKHLVRFAADARLLDLLAPYLAGAATWPVRWSLSPEQAGALYLLVAQCLETSGAVDEAQAFLVRYLATLEGASDAAKAGARAWAKTAALNFVRAPAVSQKPAVARLAAVRALANDPEHSRLLELVEIFAHGELSAYVAFHAAHGAYLGELGVEHEQSLESMRLLSLCSLAAANNVVPYEAIAAALQCREDEVEGWVVRGIAGGLLDARMDQAARTCTVTRSAQREFSRAQWGVLKDRLETWSSNIGQMLRAIEDAS